MMPYIIQIVGLISGEPSEFDGQYLVEYDPTDTEYISPSGEPMIARMVTTPNPHKAKIYNDLQAAYAELNWACGVRSDGMPNRPIAAFSVIVDEHQTVNSSKNQS